MSKKPKTDRRLEFLNLIPHKAQRILDVGCGNGNLTEHLMSQGKEVYGIDRDPDVCE